MNWALFEGGLRVSQTRQAKDQFQQALAQYDGERRKVEQAARDAYRHFLQYAPQSESAMLINRRVEVQTTTQR